MLTEDHVGDHVGLALYIVTYAYESMRVDMQVVGVGIVIVIMNEVI